MDLYWTTNLSNGDQTSIIRDGLEKKVAFEQVEEYCEKVIAFRAQEGEEQMKAMIEGYKKICPIHILKLFSWESFEERVRGPNEISVEALKSITNYYNDDENTPNAKRFWRVFESFTALERAKLLKFVWGRDRLPAKHYLASNFSLSISNSSPNDQKLPTSATCYFRLYLPSYSSDEVCKGQLLVAINSCGEIDND